MQLIHTPTLPPGCCFICRASVRESYIDTGVSHDYEGAYYICDVCLSEMATMYSYLSHDEYKDLRQQKEDLEHQVFELIKRMGQLEGIHDALAAAGYSLNSDGAVVVRGGYTATYNDGTTKAIPISTESVGVGEGETAEQSDDSEMAGLRSDDSTSDISPFDL